MKRILAFLLILSLAAALSGCAGHSPAAEESSTPTNTVTPEELPTNTVTSEERPPVHIPAPGEDLATAMNSEHLKNMAEDPPVKISVRIDHGGALETAELTDSDDIAEFIRYFSEVRIDGETDEVVTDNYNGFSLTFSDGETVSFSLNLKNLEFSAGGSYYIFTLSGFDDLWSYMNSVAEFPED